MKIKLPSKQQGFTIIEVMIVLAIAGVIIAAVLIAVPQLQRNQRNTARRNVLGRIKTEIDNYAGNNNGEYPLEVKTSGTRNFSAPTIGTGFFNRYLGCAGTSPATCTVNIKDPSTGHPVGTGRDGSSDGIAVTSTVPGAVEGSIIYRLGHKCNGEELVAQTGRYYAIAIRLEGNAVYCLDNQ